MKKVTLKDVAKRAGVSTATVSYVLNGTRGVSVASRAKIEAAIRELSYFPDQAARNLKSGRSNSIGFIIPDIANLYFSSIIEEIESILSLKDINLIVSNSKETQELELKQIRNFASGLVDGLIIASTLNDYNDIAVEIPNNFPIVFVDRGLKGCKTDQVLMSSETAMYQGVSDFTKAGYTKIGYIASIENIYTTEKRIEEFETAADMVGLNKNNYIISHTDASASTVKAIASDMIANGYTAIIAGNNLITWELVSLALQNNFNHGEPFEILGYSYGQWYSWLPFLRTIDIPTRDLGMIAIRRLLERIENHNIAPKEYILTCSYSSPKNAE